MTLTTDPRQPTLFAPPEPEHMRSMSLEDRWYFFKIANWQLVQAMESDVVRRFHDGATYISIARIFEEYRGRGKAEPGSDIGLNNDFRAPFARWLIERHPELKAVIRTRQSKLDRSE